jgi:hypothetical protein
MTMNELETLGDTIYGQRIADLKREVEEWKCRYDNLHRMTVGRMEEADRRAKQVAKLGAQVEHLKKYEARAITHVRMLEGQLQTVRARLRAAGLE